MKAVWHGKILAESTHTLVIEGNHYFPPSSLRREFFSHSETTSKCAWKGTARYYSICVNGDINKDSAWYYPSPLTAAEQIKDYVAFWRGVEIIDS
jgi:uncharacterized protein (DUF427 family)